MPGCGWIASVFTKDLLTDPTTRNAGDVRHVVQACGTSSSLERAQKFIKDVGAPESTTAYGSYKELVEDPNVDIIYVATPHSHHFPHALLALRAGKHVLCEKPFTVNAEQTKILVDLAREKKLFLMEAVWTRFFPISIEIRKLIKDGVIGDVTRVVSDLSLAQNPESTYGPNDEHRMVNPDLAGGAMLDIGIYSLTWVFQILYHLQPAGQRVAPKTTGAISKYRTGVDAETTVLLQFPNSIGVANTSLRVDTDPNHPDGKGLPCAIIQGTKGQIQVEHPAYRPMSYTLILKGQEPKRVDFTIPQGQGMHWEADECARCLRDGKLESETIGLEESIVIMECMDKVRKDGEFVYPGNLEKTDPSVWGL